MKIVKKVLLMALSFVLVAAISVGATLAFLADTDSDVNVMTVGNVKIDQVEYERADVSATGTVTLRDFTQAKPLDPAVYAGGYTWATDDEITGTVPGGAVVTMNVWKDIENEQDKFVFVKNTGMNKAYLRTWFAFELGDLSLTEWQELFHVNANTADWTWAWGTAFEAIISDVKYVVVCATYNNALASGAIAAPSLLQYAMDEDATNETVASFGNTYDILVFSQAVQTTGFSGATEALNKAFKTDMPWEGTVNGTPVDGEPVEVEPEIFYAAPSTAQEVINNAPENSIVILSSGYYESLVIANADGTAKKNLTIVPSASTLVRSAAQDATIGFLNLNSSSNITLKGLTFDAAGAKTVYSRKSGATEYVASIVAAGEGGNSGASNITVQDCTFTGLPADARKYVTFGFEEQGRPSSRTSNITIDGCTFACNAFNYIRMNYLAVGTVTITNNVFGGDEYATAHNTMNFTGNASDLVITNNEIYNWNPEKNAVGSSRQGDNFITITLTGNNFYNADLKAEGGYWELKASYTAENSKLITDGNNELTYVGDGENAVEDLDTALKSGEGVILSKDMSFSSKETANTGYGAAGVTVNGAVLDGNGNTLKVNDAYATWDCAVAAKGGTIKNLTVSGAMRGIFMPGASGDLYIDNVIFKDVIYTFNSDGGNKAYGVYISNSTLNGWTSFSAVHKEVIFTNCSFGEGSGYAFCRPYNASVFENCVFEEGFEFDTAKTSDITFINCYYGETLITAENAATLGNGETTFFYNGLNGITIQ